MGAHYDSKAPSPGASDNGTGVAAVLELARLLADVIPPYTVVFTLFGSEEIIDGNSDHHHYGSRFMAADEDLRPEILNMTSVDMVGVGSELWIDNMGLADDGWRSQLYDIGEALGYPVRTGETRAWSDHESFEHVGIPVAWVHWRYDNNYHQATDTPEKIDPELLRMSVEMLLRGITGIDGADSVRIRGSGELFSF
jgi:aminopeptidase YwaD